MGSVKSFLPKTHNMSSASSTKTWLREVWMRNISRKSHAVSIFYINGWQFIEITSRFLGSFFNNNVNFFHQDIFLNSIVRHTYQIFSYINPILFYILCFLCPTPIIFIIPQNVVLLEINSHNSCSVCVMLPICFLYQMCSTLYTDNITFKHIIYLLYSCILCN